MNAYERMDAAIERIELALTAYRNGDYLGTLRGIGNTHLHLGEAAVEVVQEAYDAGATKKAMAAALGVTASTFRGMERSR